MPESRLSRRSLKQGKKQLYWSLIGIVIIIFLALNFGPILLGAAGSVIDVITGKSRQTNTIVSDADIQPPFLDPIPQATPSAFITVTGRSFYPEGKVELYLNGSKYKSAEIDSSLDFEIEDIRLSAGENIIKARMIINNKKSDFSQDHKISLVKDAPKLEVDSPADNSSFSKADQEITIRGKTDPDNTVRVNGFIAIVDSQGSFSYVLRLNDGENKLNITAENNAGKTTSREITVSYSP